MGDGGGAPEGHVLVQRSVVVVPLTLKSVQLSAAELPVAMIPVADCSDVNPALKSGFESRLAPVDVVSRLAQLIATGSHTAMMSCNIRLVTRMFISFKSYTRWTVRGVY